jgi:hypothetical protein
LAIATDHPLGAPIPLLPPVFQQTVLPGATVIDPITTKGKEKAKSSKTTANTVKAPKKVTQPKNAVAGPSRPREIQTTLNFGKRL